MSSIAAQNVARSTTASPPTVPASKPATNSTQAQAPQTNLHKASTANARTKDRIELVAAVSGQPNARTSPQV
jgi:hypothetical protein